MWGGLFIPKLPKYSAREKTLSVMTYNVLGWHSHFEPQVELILQENPDLVFLQELNPLLAETLDIELKDEYPYQVLSPVEGFRGMGVISKYPIEPSGLSLPLDWVGEPQVLWLEWDGQEVILINFHMNTTTLGTIQRISSDNLYRESQARALVEGAQWGGPVILAGDANTTSLSNAYHLITQELSDSWLDAGYGFGHTFPGSDIPGSARPSLAGLSVPQWLARIDYIFHSDHWQAVQAYTVRFDGVSDHRGVVAVLVWLGEEQVE
jgi:endonuclease/exonuclease/phosphatase (EEP) superfamily protein YafD